MSRDSQRARAQSLTSRPQTTIITTQRKAARDYGSCSRPTGGTGGG